jgi:uncharacterized protein (TIGR04222 family)
MINPLMNNPIANLPGPDFLVLYFAIATFSTFFCYMLVKFIDPSRKLPSLNIPQAVDPYEVAYLRQEEPEVIRVIVINLTQRQYLKIEAPASTATTTSTAATSIKEAKITQNPEHPDLNLLEPLEKAIFAHCNNISLASLANKYEPKTIVLREEIKKLCQPYKLNLSTQQLLGGPAWAAKANQIKLFIISSLVFLAGYKATVALFKGHHNIGLLIFFTIIFASIIMLLGRPSRLTYRGRKYLEELQLVCAKFKYGLPTKVEQPASTTATTDSNTVPLPAIGIVDPWTITTAVGVFGVGVLASTEFNAYNTLYRVNGLSSAGSASGGCGSGCSSCSSGGGGCGSGCGGGCGGCGGGCS